MPSGIYKHKSHTEEWKRNMSNKLKGIKKEPFSEEHKKNISETRKKLFSEGKLVSPMKGKNHLKDTKEKLKIKGKVRFNSGIEGGFFKLGHIVSDNIRETVRLKNTGKKRTDEWKKQASERMKGNTHSLGFKHSEETKKKKGEKSKELWQNPEYRENQLKSMFKSLGFKPTKPERILKEIIEKNNLPFNYTGNGVIWFKGENHSFNPDFLSKNPRHIIEVFGDYWHSLPKVRLNDIERLKTFEKYGYKTLVLWEHELRKNKFGLNLSEEDIVNKINNFIGGQNE